MRRIDPHVKKGSKSRILTTEYFHAHDWHTPREQILVSEFWAIPSEHYCGRHINNVPTPTIRWILRQIMT